MKIELKSVQFAAFASHETNCFDAIVYLDGVRSIHASNEGHGGPTFLRELKPGAIGKIKAHTDAMPPYQGSSMSIPMEPDFLIDLMVEEYLAKKEIKRLLRKGIVARDPGSGSLRLFPIPDTPANIVKVRRHHPNYVILNGKSEEEQLKLYREGR